jgi:hypothetical protein
MLKVDQQSRYKSKEITSVVNEDLNINAKVKHSVFKAKTKHFHAKPNIQMQKSPTDMWY